MYEIASTFPQSELTYRTDRLKKGVAVRRGRSGRLSRVRHPFASTHATR